MEREERAEPERDEEGPGRVAQRNERSGDEAESHEEERLGVERHGFGMLVVASTGRRPCCDGFASVPGRAS
jgi:hypothetical protein